MNDEGSEPDSERPQTSNKFQDKQFNWKSIDNLFDHIVYTG